MKYLSIFTCISIVLLFTATANGQFYQCKNSSGQAVFQDKPCKNESQDTAKKETKQTQSVTKVISAGNIIDSSWSNEKEKIKIEFFSKNRVAAYEGDERFNGTWVKVAKNNYDIVINADDETVKIKALRSGSNMQLTPEDDDTIVVTLDGATKVKSEGIAELNKARVRRFLTDFEQAAFIDKDSAKFAAFISDDAVISIRASSLSSKAIVMNKEQYLDLTEQSWAMVKNYNYEITSSFITINGNTATVVDSQIESMEMFGQTIRQTSKSEMLIELEDGRLLITKLDADVKD